jgi:MATE family multidrug resistance protein
LRFRHLFRETRQIVKAGFPLAFTFAGNTLLGVVDTAVVGRLGASELAGVALANAIFYTVTVAAMGIVFGIDPIVSQALGAGEGARARAALRAGLRLALLVAVPVVAVLALAPLAFGSLGIEARTAGFGSEFLWARTLGAVPFLLVLAFRSYLQGRNFTRPLVVGTVLANVVNLLGNLVLVFGDASLERIGLPAVGMPALGVAGSAIASNLASAAQAILIFVAVRRLLPAEGGGDTRIPYGAIVRVGLPIGLTLLAEVGAFSIAGVLAARIGPTAASGHQVAITLASLTFTVAMGFANATSVRVGRAVGRGDARAARLAGVAGFTASTGAMSLTALAFLVFAPELAGTMSNRPEVLASAIPLLYVAAAFQLFDGAQVVGAGALRGLGNTRFIQHANIVGYYAIGLPISVALAFGAGLAERGLWWGLCAGLAFVAAALFWKFLRAARGEIRRI